LERNRSGPGLRNVLEAEGSELVAAPFALNRWDHTLAEGRICQPAI